MLRQWLLSLFFQFLVFQRFGSVNSFGVMQNYLLKPSTKQTATLAIDTFNGSLPILSIFNNRFQYEDNQISASCMDDLRYLVDLHDSNYSSNVPVNRWQAQMLDSYGKWPPGLLEGNVFWMGDFEQCTSVKVWRSRYGERTNAKPDFGGQYCVPNTNHLIPKLNEMKDHKLPIIATFGVCLPSTCTAADTETIINKYLNPVRVKVTELECQKEDSQYNYDTGTIVALIPFLLLGCFVVAGTIHEIIPKIRNTTQSTTKCERPSKGFAKFLQTFSAYRNTIKLLDTTKKNEELSCINGIRAMCMILIVTGHTTLFMYVMNNGKHNPVDMAKIRSNLWTQPVIHAPYCVETFFFLTGFLTTLHTLKRAVQTNRFNIRTFYIHRIWRLAPPLLLLSALVSGPFQLTGNGPLWTTSPFYMPASICQKSWWKTALFISVYFKDTSGSTACLPHTWYLSVEMFYYVFSPIILYPLMTKRWKGPIIWCTLFVLSYVLTGFAEYDVVKDTTNAYTSFDTKHNQHKLVNIKPWCKMQTFLLGMLFGYVYHCYEQRDFTLSKKVKSLMWIAVATTMITCVFGNYIMQNGIRGEPAKFEYFMDFTFSPSAWVISVGCIIIACATGNGGVVNKILSWKFLVPIGRLSFSAYLIHFQVAAHFSLTRKQALYTDYPLLWYSWVSISVVTLLFSWIFSLLVEVPTLQLETMLLKRTGPKRNNNENEQIASPNNAVTNT